MHEKIYEELKKVARDKKLLTYSDIDEKVGLRANDPELW